MSPGKSPTLTPAHVAFDPLNASRSTGPQNAVGAGIVLVATPLFQPQGNTIPALVASPVLNHEGAFSPFVAAGELSIRTEIDTCKELAKVGAGEKIKIMPVRSRNAIENKQNGDFIFSRTQDVIETK